MSSSVAAISAAPAWVTSARRYDSSETMRRAAAQALDDAIDAPLRDAAVRRQLAAPERQHPRCALEDLLRTRRLRRAARAHRRHERSQPGVGADVVMLGGRRRGKVAIHRL